MKGYFGIGLIALGIFAAVMGGFILNAETVTTCSTEWEYVTDVGAAFQGDDSDMDVSYNPPENITGWSYQDSYNHGRISGVEYGETTATNSYRAVTGDAEIVPYTMTVTATDHSGTTSEPGFTAQVSGASAFSGTMPASFGLHGSEAVTFFRAGLSGYTAGAFGIPLTMLASAVPDYASLYTLSLSVATSGATPCIAAVELSRSTGPYTHGGAVYSSVTLANVYATAYSGTAIVNCKEATVDIGDKRLPLSSVYLVWGHAQFNGSGSYDSDVTVTMSGTLETPWAYIDPAKGVVPVYGTYTSTTMQFVEHPTSSSPTVDISFDGTGTATGTIEADGAEIAAWFWNSEGSTHVVSVTPTGGSQATANGDGLSGSIGVTVSGGLFTIAFADTSVTYQASATAFSEMSVSIEVTGDLPWTVQIGRDDGSADEFSGSSSLSGMLADLSYVTYQPTTTTVSYSTVYWYNGEDEQNAQVVMAFTADSLPASNTFLFRGPDGDSPVRIVCDSDRVWTVGSVEIGKWTGIQVTVGYGQMTIVPISHFRTFLDYVTVDKEATVYSATAVGGGTVTSIAVSEPPSGSSLRMCVVSTIIHIPEGGLYLQNGVLDMDAAFPGSQALSVMIGSAATMGDGITFATSGTSVTVPVDADGRMLYVGERWYDINGVTFRWYSSGAESATIDGQTYAPAIYHNGGTYDAGKIWAEVEGGKMVEVMDAASAWTMTLDGVWAPSVFLYEGENVASSSVEISDFMHGEYRWDKNTFIIVMMAVSVVGGVIGSYFKAVDAWDWIAIIGTVGVLWMVL